MKLEGRTVLLTGASHGIGRALVLELAKRKCRIVLSARDTEALKDVKLEVQSLGGEGIVIPCDLAQEKERTALVEKARTTCSSIDVLINNAGQGLYGAVSALQSQDLRSIFELNVVAPAHLSALLLPTLEAQEESAIVMISSVLGRRAIPYSGGYCASKFALEGLSESLRAELSATSVNLLVCRPGRTKSGFRDRALLRGAVPPDSLQAMSAKEVAARTVRALANGASYVDFSVAGRAMMLAARVSPRATDTLMKLVGAKMRRVESQGDKQ